MGRVFVVNASPLILLARIGRLELLGALADKVLVPRAVMDELAAGAGQDDAARAVASYGGAELIEDAEVPGRLAAWDLGPGESQVLAQAIGRPGTEAVLDDRAARRCARVMGVAYTGTLGVVVGCRRAGAIPVARPVVETLIAAGIRLSPDLVARSLAEVGE